MFKTSKSRIVVGILLTVTAITALVGALAFGFGVDMEDGTTLYGWTTVFFLMSAVWVTLVACAIIIAVFIALVNWIDKGE